MTNFVCPACSLDPLSHSLKKIKETEEFIWFYTCPSNARLYFDKDGIIKHYDGVLNEIPPNKKWIWIFDSLNFDFKHFIQFDLGIELAKLISNKFSENLNKIIIINPTMYISYTYNFIYPFLNNKIKSLVEFDYTTKTIDNMIL